jgi:hypothetical protein
VVASGGARRETYGEVAEARVTAFWRRLLVGTDFDSIKNMNTTIIGSLPICLY